MVVNKTQRNLMFAYDKGYRCNESGQVSFLDKPPLKLYYNTTGYLCFSVRLTVEIHGKVISRAIPVHRLQAFQKFGNLIFGEGIHVRHLNGNCVDNSWQNLDIGTASENMMDKTKEVRMLCAINASNKIRRFTDDELITIREFYLVHKSYAKTMKEFNISSKGTLHHMLNNVYKTTK